MGGKALKNVKPLSKDEASNLIKTVIPKLMNDLKVSNYDFVGSVLDDEVINDIDIIIQVSERSTKLEKERIFNQAQLLFGKENSKIVGQLVCINLPVPDRTEGCQVDIIPCVNIVDAKWLMKGVFRHMLFALLAKKRTDALLSFGIPTKITISVPDGMRVMVNGSSIPVQITSPKIILENLYLKDVEPEDVLSFADLVAVVEDQYPEILREYCDYVSHLQNKRGYLESVELVRNTVARHN
jgi:hypothetical protein